MKFFSILLILFHLLYQPLFSGNWQPVLGRQGMVVSADSFATAAGIEVLRNGGNAVDAAIAVGFVLAVTYPQAGNTGGGGFMMIRTADGIVYALDYREKAPLLAHRDMYLDTDGNVVSEASVAGYLACGVPGTVRGFFNAHSRFGSLPWSDLLDDAIRYAENGFTVSRSLSESFSNNNDKLKNFPATRQIFLKNGKPWSQGDVLVQKDLARTLENIKLNGALGFYQGIVARRIVEDMSANQGLISHKDLNEYESVWRTPIDFDYRNHRIFSAPPPSSGGVLIAQILNALENVQPAKMGYNSSELIHLWAEIEKQVYRDRARYLGDPDFVTLMVNQLTSKEYGRRVFGSVDPNKTQLLEADLIEYKESTETTHFSVVDPFGNAVSNTYTLNSSFGSGVVIEGTGILMNNEMDDFSIKPGFANIYGLVGSEANEIAPGKRMLSSMTPTIVTRHDSLFMLLGSPGGSTIITTVAQVLSNVIDHKMNIREAVESPRFHHQWYPDSLRIEPFGFSNDVKINLENKGHLLQITGAIGEVQGILYSDRYHEWSGWSDPRGNGLCLGF